MEFDSWDFDIGIRVRKARDRRGMTQVSLAKATGLTQSAIAQIESGKIQPKFKTLFLISKALDISLSAFFGDTVPNHILGASIFGQLWWRLRYWWYRRNRNKSIRKAS